MLRNVEVLFICIALTMLPTGFSTPNDCLKYDEDKSCKENGVQFYLRMKEKEEHELEARDEDSIRKAAFKNAPIKFIIHGHYEHRDDFFVTPLQLEYFKLGYNVIMIQYTNLSKKNCYPSGVENSLQVARCSTEIIEKIIQLRGREISDFHIIGISLGGQIAGQMPHFLTEGIGGFSRITGIDPANEGFYGEYDTDKYTLTEKDAEFVDVIHTNAGFIGKFRQMGHVDWYANLGVLQPGCRISDYPCSHMRSVVLFLESIGNPKTEVVAEKCDNLEMKYLTPEKCEKNLIVIFGEYATKATIEKVIYFFETRAKPPYTRSDAEVDYPVYKKHLIFTK